MKETFCGIWGAALAWVASWFGGWSAAMTTLLVLMAADYITGLLVAGLFHNSPKTESGLLDSHAGWKGLAKKGVVLLFILIASRLDIIMQTSYLKDAVCIAYIINELMSLIENAGLMGVPVPAALLGAIEALKKTTDSEDTSPEAE